MTSRVYLVGSDREAGVRIRAPVMLGIQIHNEKSLPRRSWSGGRGSDPGSNNARDPDP